MHQTGIKMMKASSIFIPKGMSLSQNIAAWNLKYNEVMASYIVMVRPAIKYSLCSSTLTRMIVPKLIGNIFFLLTCGGFQF